MTRRALALRHVPFEDLGILEPLLRARGYEVDYRDVGVDVISPEIALAPDVLVVLGGPVGVYDTGAYPALEAEGAAIAARLTAGTPTVGICLGAQFIAKALGADVTSTGRTEIGYSPISITPQARDSVLAPLDGVPVLHWHGDEFQIPDGAMRLAETPGFPNQAFSVGNNILGLQFHLEADHTQIERWLIGHAHELATAGIDPNRIRADAARYGPALAAVAGDVLETWFDNNE